MKTKTRQTEKDAAAAAAVARVTIALERLGKFERNMAAAGPLGWGDIEFLRHVGARLDELADLATQTGEYAPAVETFVIWIRVGVGRGAVVSKWQPIRGSAVFATRDEAERAAERLRAERPADGRQVEYVVERGDR